MIRLESLTSRWYRDKPPEKWEEVRKKAKKKKTKAKQQAEKPKAEESRKRRFKRRKEAYQITPAAGKR